MTYEMKIARQEKEMQEEEGKKKNIALKAQEEKVVDETKFNNIEDDIALITKRVQKLMMKNKYGGKTYNKRSSYKKKGPSCHTLIPGLTRMADSNWVRGARLYTGTLIDLFFLRVELVPVGIQTISVITKIIYIYKRTITGVVSIKIYAHILSPIYLYKHLYIYMSNKNIRDRGSSASEHLSMR